MAAKKQPERFINRSLLLQAVLLLLVQAMSVIMLVWSTVVLLGGFVSSLPLKDYLYISVISGVQMLRVFDILVDEQYILFSNALFKPLFRCMRWLRRIWKKSKYNKLQPSLDGTHHSSAIFSKFRRMLTFKNTLYLLMDTVLLIVLVFVVFHPLLVLYSCVVLSLSRLRNGYFGDHSIQNLYISCRIFYILASAQGSIYILWYLVNLTNVCLKQSVANKCGFNPIWGLEAVNQYFKHTQSMSFKDLLTQHVNMMGFGIGLLGSEGDADFLLGARLTVFFIENGEVLVRSLRSPETVQKLITVLAWKQRDRYDMELRMLTLKMLAHVSEDLCLAHYPGLLERLSSLFDLSREGECLLMEQGFFILEGLSRDKFNSITIYRNDILLNRICDIMFYTMKTLSVEWIRIQNASMSFMAKTLGDIGDVSPLCQFIASRLDVKNIISYTDFPDLQFLAIAIWTSVLLSCRNIDTESLKSFIASIVPYFLTLGEEMQGANCFEVKPDVRIKAGNSLSLLSMESEPVCQAIMLVEADLFVKLYRILCLPNKTVHRIAAEVLRDVCFHCTIQCTEEMLEKVIQLFVATTKTQEHSDHIQIEVQVGPPGEIQDDVGLQAALLSIIAVMYSKALINSESFARVVDENTDGFMKLLREMVERNCRDVDYGVEFVKACATLVTAILRYDPHESNVVYNLHKNLINEIHKEKLVESLCLASRSMRGIEVSLIGARELVVKKSFWKTSLHVLVQECTDASAYRR